MMNTTKQALADTLKRLLLKKPFSKITVKDIAEGGGVNRMTFYYHFQDIYDLAHWIIREETRQILDSRESFGSWQAVYLAILEEMRANRPLVLNAARNFEEDGTELFLLDSMERLLLAVIEEESQGLAVSEESKRRVADFYKFAFLGTTLEWIADEMRDEPAQIVTAMEKITEGNFRRALERLGEEK